MTSPPAGPTAQRTYVRISDLLLDAAIVAFVLLLLAVVVTGGGQIQVGGIRIRARSVDNPVWILTALLIIRYISERGRPSGMPESQFGRGLRAGATWLHRLPGTLERLFDRPLLATGALALVTFLIKATIAWSSPGFFSGDDVEIHEMSIGALLAKRWSVWELRSSFFPLTFVYPAQWLVAMMGATAPGTLVLAGRVSVALLSSAALPLTWLAARRLAPQHAAVGALAVLLLAVNKLFISFGSSELPRPVSTVFVLAAFIMSLRPQRAAAVIAGMLLGVAIAFRFSEVVFLAPAVLLPLLSRQWARAVWTGAAAVFTAAAITGLADALYRDAPLASAVAAIDYTLIEGRSSRGYEPAWEYVRIVSRWSTPLLVALAVLGSSRRAPDTWWLWTPIIALSLLPHKESRYLIPVIPFLCIAAARGLVRVMAWADTEPHAVGARRWSIDLLAPLLVLSVLHDAGSWRLRRANEGVRLAEHLRQSGGQGIAAEDFWTLGGRPYLWQQEPLLNLDPQIIAAPGTLTAAVADKRWIAMHPRTATPEVQERLGALGFARDRSWTGDEYVLFVRR
jgi:hypothetical protein